VQVIFVAHHKVVLRFTAKRGLKLLDLPTEQGDCMS
jgi:hypothetical protein